MINKNIITFEFKTSSVKAVLIETTSLNKNVHTEAGLIFSSMNIFSCRVVA